jgi:hypothetical protein
MIRGLHNSGKSGFNFNGLERIIFLGLDHDPPDQTANLARRLGGAFPALAKL